MATSTPSAMTLATSHFQDALASYIDESKPDALARQQIQRLRLSWEQHHGDGSSNTNGAANNDIDESTPRDEIAEAAPAGECRTPSQPWAILRGTLDLSSEYITLSIHVTCRWRIHDDTTKNGTATGQDCEQENSNHPDPQDASFVNGAKFQNEFHIQLHVAANVVSLADYTIHMNKIHNNDNSINNNDDNNDGTAAGNNGPSSSGGNKSKQIGAQDRKERAIQRKLRGGMLDRLRADPHVRRLFVNDDSDNQDGDGDGDGGKGKKKNKINNNKMNKEHSTPKNSAPLLLCEALIQQQSSGSGGGMEERVDVQEKALEGIKNAIFSHCEDNLDVLELLLSMPFLPRRRRVSVDNDGRAAAADSNDGGGTANLRVMSTLAERAYLRLLEDAMFDACEKEGEDEMLDDLNISEGKEDDGRSDDQCKDRKSVNAGTTSDSGNNGKGGLNKQKKQQSQSKRVK